MMTKTQPVPKGIPLAVLKAISNLGPNACGVTIHETINGNAGREMPPSQIYVVLRRLSEKGLLSSKEQKQPTGVRGHPRRIYTVTADGKKALNAALRLYGLANE